MIRASCLALLLASTVLTTAHAQTKPTIAASGSNNGSPVTTRADVANALGAKADAANGVLTAPTIMGSDATNPAIAPVGPNGLPNVYGPNHIILPNNSLQIDLAHPMGSRGLATGLSVQVGNGAAYNNINNGSPPVGPTVDTWESNPTTLSSYGAIDSVGLVVANGAEANHQAVPSVTILSSAPDVVNAPAGQTFNALACRQGEIVALNTTPALWGAVTGCPTSSRLTVQGWEVPNGANLNPVNSAPNQNPTNTSVYTQPATLTLTALAPTHPFTVNTLTFMGASGTVPTSATGWEHDSVCQAASCLMDGADIFSNFGRSQTGVDIDGALAGGWYVGEYIAHAHYAGLHIDLSDENLSDYPAPTAILLDKKYSNFVIARTANVVTWGVDNQGDETLAGTLQAGAGAILQGTNAGYALRIIGSSGNAVALWDATGDMHITGGAQIDGVAGSAGSHLAPTTYAGLGPCTPGDIKYASDGKNADGTLGVMAYCNGSNIWYANGSPLTH